MKVTWPQSYLSYKSASYKLLCLIMQLKVLLLLNCKLILYHHKPLLWSYVRGGPKLKRLVGYRNIIIFALQDLSRYSSDMLCFCVQGIFDFVRLDEWRLRGRTRINSSSHLVRISHLIVTMLIQKFLHKLLYIFNFSGEAC